MSLREVTGECSNFTTIPVSGSPFGSGWLTHGWQAHANTTRRIQIGPAYQGVNHTPSNQPVPMGQPELVYQSSQRQLWNDRSKRSLRTWVRRCGSLDPEEHRNQAKTARTAPHPDVECIQRVNLAPPTAITADSATAAIQSAITTALSRHRTRCAASHPDRFRDNFLKNTCKSNTL